MLLGFLLLAVGVIAGLGFLLAGAVLFAGSLLLSALVAAGSGTRQPMAENIRQSGWAYVPDACAILDLPEQRVTKVLRWSVGTSVGLFVATPVIGIAVHHL